jgi:hypothetical protein
MENINATPVIFISVVSHGHIGLIESLLHDDAHCRAIQIEPILTLNLDEMLPFVPDHFSFSLNRTQLTDPKSRIASLSDIWRVLDKHLISKITKS